MAYKLIRMDIINHIQDLKLKNTSIKKMARILDISKNSVKKYLKKLEMLDFGTYKGLNTEHFEQIYPENYKHNEELLSMMSELLKTLFLEGKTREHI